MKMVVMDGFSENPGDLSWAGLAALGELTVYDRTPPAQRAERLRGVEVAITNKTVFDRALMESCDSLRYIGILATGYNIVDVEAARERGITVCNAPGYSTMSVAQLAVGFLLEIASHIGEHSRAVHEGKWTQNPDFSFWSYPLIELAGKTLGILGLGAIGQSVAKIAQALGMEVIAYRRSGAPGTVENGVRLVTEEELFAQSEFLTLHCPLNDESAGIINEKNIGKMRDGASVINTARGGCVVPADVRAALDAGKLAWFAADVSEKEPIPADDPILGSPRAILTPHLAWATLEARTRLMDITVENLRAYLDGKPQNVVN